MSLEGLTQTAQQKRFLGLIWVYHLVLKVLYLMAHLFMLVV